MEPAQTPNRRLRLQRRLRGWSQEDVAAGLHRLAGTLGEPELGVDATMVSRWERGMRRPRPRYVRLLSQLFQLPAEQLGIVDEPDLAVLSGGPRSNVPEADGTPPEFFGKISTLLGVTALARTSFEPAVQEPWERLARALRQPGRVDDETVDHLQRITAALRALGPTQISPPALLGPVVGHLDAITLLLRGSLQSRLHARLCSLAAATSAFAGWLRWNMDDPSAAAGYFHAGLEAAREAGNRAIAAYLMGSSACQPPYREDPEERLRRLRGCANGFMRTDATPTMQMWMAAKEADACALMRDAEGCLRALDRAHELLVRTYPDDADARPPLNEFGATWLEGERGASLAKLGRTAEARDLLQHVLEVLGPTSEHDRLWLSAALASTYLQDGEPEEACIVLRATVDRASRIRAESVLRLVQDMRRQMSAFEHNPAVRELDEQMQVASGTRLAS